MNQNIYRTIASAGFSRKTYYILRIYGNCNTLRDVIRYNADDLLKLPCFSKRTLNEVINVLEGYDLYLSKGNIPWRK